MRQDAQTTSGRPGAGLDQRFSQLDRNGDGKLTPDELTDPATFKRLDANGDGVVTLDEARAAYAGRPARKGKK